MTAFVYALAEWRTWRAERRQVGLLVGVVAASVSICFDWLGAWCLSVALPATVLGLGWSSGSRYSRGQRFRKLLLGSPVQPSAGALGKALASSAEGCFSVLVLAPPAILSLALWQRGPTAALLLLLSLLIAFLLSAAAGFLASLLFGDGDRLLGPYFFAAWIPATSLVPAAAPFSPFIQAWAALGGADPGPGILFVGLAVEALAAAALFAAGSKAIASARRRDARD